MRKSHTEEEIEQALKSLPPEVKHLLDSDELDSIIQKVGTKNQLHIDQMGFLQSETKQVLMGFVETKDFPANLMETLEIDRMKADAVAQDVNDMLFTKIRESMKQAPVGEKSVIMPSSLNSSPKPPMPAAPTSTPGATPAPVSTMPKAPAPAIAPVPAMTTPSVPTKPPEMHPAEVMLTEKTVQVAPPAPQSTAPMQKPAAPEAPKPAAYKADPYREPPE